MAIHPLRYLVTLENTWHCDDSEPHIQYLFWHYGINNLYPPSSYLTPNIHHPNARRHALPLFPLPCAIRHLRPSRPRRCLAQARRQRPPLQRQNLDPTQRCKDLTSTRLRHPTGTVSHHYHLRFAANPARHQLKCIGGNARGLYEIDVMRCKNQGADYDDEKCDASLLLSPPRQSMACANNVVPHQHPRDLHRLASRPVQARIHRRHL